MEKLQDRGSNLVGSLHKFKVTQQFGNIGLKVKTYCMYCDVEPFEGHRDKGIRWFQKHMKKQHKDILETRGEPIKRTRRKFAYGHDREHQDKT